MIHTITSDLSGFKPVVLRRGLNVILADRTPGATDRQTRNGAGKSSLVELVHFLLGASAGPDALFRTRALASATFHMTFDVDGERVTVSRTGATPSKVRVTPGSTVFSNEQWKAVLGERMFELPDPSRHTGAPSFRSLFSYFARRQKAGGFQVPSRHAAQQQAGDLQVALTWLLGLDWSIPAAWEQVRIRERSLRELKKAAGEGAFGSVIGKAADLRTELTIAEDELRRMNHALESFRVHERYNDLEKEASELGMEISGLIDANVLDARYLAHLQEEDAAEVAPGPDDLRKVYGEAGLVLPDAVLRRFDDVQRFHESVVQNRRAYLAGEIRDAEERRSERSRRRAQIDARRAELLELMQGRGAMEHLVGLQQEAGRQAAAVEAIRQRYESAEQLESASSALTLERVRLTERLKLDYREQGSVLAHAVLVFEELSRSLYEQAGHLTIADTDNGPDFQVKIQGQASRGIQNMQIFCFDLMLAQLCAERGIGPGFLIHDSHLFDGVDERQVAKALVLGARKADELGFQYIVTMNSDAIPTSLPADFDLASYVVEPRLTDASEDGGLFGVRFG